MLVVFALSVDKVIDKQVGRQLWTIFAGLFFFRGVLLFVTIFWNNRIHVYNVNLHSDFDFFFHTFIMASMTHAGTCFQQDSEQKQECIEQ